jgi:hypothetical protein
VQLHSTDRQKIKQANDVLTLGMQHLAAMIGVLAAAFVASIRKGSCYTLRRSSRWTPLAV